MENCMETISLKALALKVLERNSLGNQKETIPDKVGNFNGNKIWEGKLTPEGSYREIDREKSLPLEELLSLPLDDFKSQNLAVRIRSKVLGEDIWLVSNEETRDHLEAEGLVCYLPEEVRNLKDLLSPEDIRKVHETKKVFEKSRLIK